MRFHGATDRNHAEIGRALRSVTVVKDMRAHGGVGYDFLARHLYRGWPVFIEVKDGQKPPSGRTLTKSEAWMREAYPGYFAVVLTVDEALAAVGVSVRR